MPFTKIIARVTYFSVASILLSGCVGAVSETANIAKDKIIISNNIKKAQAGDPEAQFKVGDSLCCSIGDSNKGFYDTKKSIEWLCRSADSQYGPAAFKIAQIYSGDTVSGVRVIRRIASKIAGKISVPSVAYSWFRFAEKYGEKDARKRADSMWASLDEKEREEAREYVTGQKKLPCLWADVNS
jgi:TPR repeat protein